MSGRPQAQHHRYSAPVKKTCPPVEITSTEATQHASRVSIRRERGSALEVKTTFADGTRQFELEWDKASLRRPAIPTDPAPIWFRDRLADGAAPFGIVLLDTKTGAVVDPQGAVLGAVTYDQTSHFFRTRVAIVGKGLRLSGQTSLLSPAILGNREEIPQRYRLQEHGDGPIGLTLWSQRLLTLRARASDIDPRLDWRLVTVFALQTSGLMMWWR